MTFPIIGVAHHNGPRESRSKPDRPRGGKLDMGQSIQASRRQALKVETVHTFLGGEYPPPQARLHAPTPTRASASRALDRCPTERHHNLSRAFAESVVGAQLMARGFVHPCNQRNPVPIGVLITRGRATHRPSAGAGISLDLEACVLHDLSLSLSCPTRC